MPSRCSPADSIQSNPSKLSNHQFNPHSLHFHSATQPHHSPSLENISPTSFSKSHSFVFFLGSRSFLCLCRPPCRAPLDCSRHPITRSSESPNLASLAINSSGSFFFFVWCPLLSNPFHEGRFRSTLGETTSPPFLTTISHRFGRVDWSGRLANSAHQFRPGRVLSSAPRATNNANIKEGKK